MGKTSKQLSNCCQAGVIIGGAGDFSDSDIVQTRYYICSRCEQACDIYVPDKKERTGEFKRAIEDFAEEHHLNYEDVEAFAWYIEKIVKNFHVLRRVPLQDTCTVSF